MKAPIVRLTLRGGEAPITTEEKKRNTLEQFSDLLLFMKS